MILLVCTITNFDTRPWLFSLKWSHYTNWINYFPILLFTVVIIITKIVYSLIFSSISFLQKVEFWGRDQRTNTEYTSVIRSCSQGECIPHADNCTAEMLTNPGCMTRYCCNDRSFCNGSVKPSKSTYTLLVFSLMEVIVIHLGTNNIWF